MYVPHRRARVRDLRSGYTVTYPNLIFAYYIARWQRGLVPMAAALGIVLLILAVIAGTGAGVTSWFDRNHAGFTAPQSLFGDHGPAPASPSPAAA